MRWFVFRFALYTIPVLLIAALFEISLRQIPNNYSYIDDQLLHHGDSIEVLILGNSHAFNGVNPEGFGVPAFNAASISQDHRFDRALFERYLDRLPRLKAVVIPVSYASIGGRIELGNEPWRMKNYAIYMGQSAQTRNIEDRLEIMSRLKGEQFRSLIGFWFRGETNITCDRFGGKPGKSDRDLDFSTEAVVAVNRHSKGPLGPYRANLNELNELIRTAERRGIRTLLFAPPGHSTYRALLDPQQLGLSKVIPRQLDREHGSVRYIDLLADARFVTSDFSNPDHLNASGNKRLTSILAEELNN